MSVGIIELLLIFAGLALLVRLRNRPLVVLLVLAIVGGVFLLARIQTRTVVVAGQHAHQEAWDAQQAHLEEQRRAVAEHRAEILKNQRLAARMDDATVQHSPDGSILETYPDGMQVREFPWSAERQIIHEADSSFTFYTPYHEGGAYQTQTRFGFAVLLLPLLVLFALFTLLRGRGGERSDRKSTGAGWVVAGAAALLLGAFFMVGFSRTTVVHEAPSPAVNVDPKIPAPPSAPTAPPIQGQVVAAIPQTVEELQEEVEEQVGEFESLESLWEHLTAPRIKLVEETEELTERSQQELADAARLVLRQSLPAADPFTQGWLTNAAKAIVQAAKPATGQSHDEAAVQTVAIDGAQAEAPETAAVPAEMPVDSSGASFATAEPVATAAASSVTQPPTGRPDWVDLPPHESGGIFRIVVSTDEFAAVEECRTQLENRLRYAVADRVRSVVSKATGRPITSGPMLAEMGVDADYIRRVLCVADYEESSSDGTKRIYALLQFNPQQESQLIERWHAAKRGERVTPMYPVAAAAKAYAKSYTTGERPEWIDQPPKLVGNTRRVVVSTDPFSTVDECYVQLEERLRYAVADRVRQLAEQATGRPLGNGPSLDEMGVRSDYVFRELCPEPDYVETVKASFGDMQRAHALLEFTPQQDEFLLERWRAAMRTERVASVAALGACLLGGLASIFGLLKVDTWTRGYYTKRLFIGVPAAIIGCLIAIAAMFA